MVAMFTEPSPSYGASLDKDWGVEAQRFGDNYSAHFTRGINRRRRRWRVSWEDLDQQVYEDVEEFFDTLGTDYITWTPPSEVIVASSGKFRVESNSWRATINGYDRWTVSVVLYEVFDP